MSEHPHNGDQSAIRSKSHLAASTSPPLAEANAIPNPVGATMKARYFLKGLPKCKEFKGLPHQSSGSNCPFLNLPRVWKLRLWLTCHSEGTLLQLPDLPLVTTLNLLHLEGSIKVNYINPPLKPAYSPGPEFMHPCCWCLVETKHQHLRAHQKQDTPIQSVPQS